MADDDEARLHEALRAIDFAARYYAAADATRGAPGGSLDAAEFRARITARWPDARRLGQGVLGRERQLAEGIVIGLRAARLHGDLELSSLYVRRGEAIAAAGTFHGLARALAEAPPTPPYPRIPPAGIDRALALADDALDALAAAFAPPA